MSRLSSEQGSKPERPIITYTKHLQYAIFAILFCFFLSIGGYSVLTGDQYEGVLIVAGLLIPEFYLIQWRTPVRRADFMQNHFVLSGWKVNVDAGYETIGNLSKYRRILGDVSDYRVSFTVGENPNVFVIPNRRNRRQKIDLYCLLEEKTKSSH